MFRFPYFLPVFILAIIFFPTDKAYADVDADAYFARIAATSSMSVSDQAVITTFVENAKAHGYWNKIIDMSPLAGNNLAAALVKLKYPNASSTLVARNFVEADYSRANGLQGGGKASPKWLSTGVGFRGITQGVGGLSFWVNRHKITNPNNFQTLIGITNTATPYVHLSVRNIAFGSVTFSRGRNMEGLNYAVRSSPSMLRLFRNGGMVASSETVSTTGTTSRNAFISVFAATGEETSGPFEGSGSFYSIDDGTLTDLEIASFTDDVRNMQIGLGRLPASPTPMKFAIVTGQSLSVGSQGSPVLSSTTQSQSYNNKYFTDGLGTADPEGRKAVGSIYGLNTESIEYSMTNLISRLTRETTPGDASHDLLVQNVGAGGYSYSMLKKGTTRYNLSLSMLESAKTYAQNYLQAATAVPGVIVVHGESDGRSHRYQADIEEWQKDYENDIKAITGQSGTIPLFHTQISAWTGDSGIESWSTSPYHLLAAYEANPTKTVLVGPKYFITYAADGLHLNNYGYRRLGEYYAKAWHKVVVLGQTFSPLRPSNVKIEGKSIDVTFTGNVGNLALDTTLVSNPGNFGFEYYDNATSTSISSVSLVSSTTVRIELNDVPTGDNKRIRYAYSGIPGNSGGPTTGPRGNLRDSDPTLSASDDDSNGSRDNLYNWAVHFDKPVVTLALSDVVTNVGQTSATITWTSNENASSSVEYGLTTAYGANVISDTLTKNHSFTIDGLMPGTTYYFRVSGSDMAKNTVSSADFNFTTPGVATPYFSAGSSGGAAAIPDSLKPFLSTGTVSANTGNPNTTNPNTANPPAFSFARSLATGANGIDVRQLQVFLNRNGYVVSAAGAGSFGNETMFFGRGTRLALAKFQKANSINPAVGFFGPVTRAFIANMK